MDKENLEYERCGGPLYHWPVALPGRSLCFGRKSGLARIGQLHRALPVTGLLGKSILWLALDEEPGQPQATRRAKLAWNVIQVTPL